jgi:hypothetical protein
MVALVVRGQVQEQLVITVAAQKKTGTGKVQEMLAFLTM